MERIEKAYAKINLFLDVTGKRADGYHTIKSVMHTVSLADTVTVRASDADYSCITLQVENAPLPADERNLAYLAAEAYLSETGITAAVSIQLDKAIPMQAGLGGGSADAAAVLRALNYMFGALDDERLLKLGATLGADVPFCIRGGTCLCEGVGDRLSPCAEQKEWFVIAVAPEEKMATPEAYRMLDKAFDGFQNESPELHQMLFSLFEEEGIYGMYNIFESVVLPQREKTAALRSRLISLGAQNALMSGSGTAVFGVFENEDAARYAANDIEGAFVCTSVNL